MISKIKSLLLAGVAFGAAFVAAGRPAAAQAPVPLDTVRVASGLTLPTHVTHAPGDTARLFITEQRSGTVGRVRILNIPGNTLNATPYLSVSPVSVGNEEGLLGLAFHPNFATNGFFYVYYTNSSGNNQIVRYTANAPFMTSTTADAASATQVITFSHPTNSNHNGGWIGFGPDNYLYAGTGDGGSGNDPPGNGQNINAVLGKILRIDVNGDDFPADTTKNYAIPPTNPFAGATPGADEVWHYGIRNPWRCSFDRQTGDFWIGDVGQNAIEEIDFVPAGLGGLNFGWRCMEGLSCTGLTGCTCNAPTLTLPVHTYPHTAGACSVTGGYRYRGSALCGWNGVYFFADYCSAQISSFSFNGSTISNLTNRTAELAPGGGLAINSITSFGEDEAGELYIVDQGGEIFKVIPGTAITDCNNNGIHDGCDILNGTSLDANTDGIPDECQPVITAYCFGDGSGTPCPCSTGVAGAGCPNSVFTPGASLVGSGFASVSSDSLQLNASGMPNGPCLYFQGTVKLPGSNPGAGAVFGDGLRCAGGSVIRLAIKTNIGGASQLPDLVDPGIAGLGGLTSGPVTRFYQVWYRDSDITFCNPEVYNLTNGVEVHWVP